MRKKFGVRKSAFLTPEPIRKSLWVQNSLFRTRNKMNGVRPTGRSPDKKSGCTEAVTL